MHIQYLPSTFVLLSVLITVSACQGNAHRMYMDTSDSSAISQSTKKHNTSAMSLRGITDTLPGMHLEEASVETSSATPSPSNSGDGGSPMSAQASLVQGIEASEGAKPKEGISQSFPDRQAASEHLSEAHETWFHEFVNAVDNAEEWSEIERVLKAGKPLEYLIRPIVWEGDQYTPLHYAAEAGDLAVVKELVENNNIPADVRTGRCKRTPLHLAALGGHLDVVKYLINHHAEWGVLDIDGSNGLHYAASGVKKRANTAIVSYMINELGADAKSLIREKFNLLHLAIKATNVDLVRYIVREIPELTSEYKENVSSPLQFAEFKDEKEIADIIRKSLQDQQGPCGQLHKNCSIS